MNAASWCRSQFVTVRIWCVNANPITAARMVVAVIWRGIAACNLVKMSEINPCFVARCGHSWLYVVASAGFCVTSLVSRRMMDGLIFMTFTDVGSGSAAMAWLPSVSASGHCADSSARISIMSGILLSVGALHGCGGGRGDGGQGDGGRVAGGREVGGRCRDGPAPCVWYSL